jgi:hypothetical protein
MTFGTATQSGEHIPFTPMEAIVTIASYAAITCGVALIALLWRYAERADKAEIEPLRSRPRSGERAQK